MSVSEIEVWDEENFSLLSDECASRLVDFSLSCQFTLRFTPAAEGNYFALLAVALNHEGQNEIVLAQYPTIAEIAGTNTPPPPPTSRRKKKSGGGAIGVVETGIFISLVVALHRSKQRKKAREKLH